MKTKTMFSIMKVIAIIICLAACSGQIIKASTEEVNPETKTKKAYEIPASYAGGSVLEGTVTMVGDRIISCDIKEYGTMLSWGSIPNEEIAKLGEDNIQTALFLNPAVGPVNTGFAKFVQVGDIIFTAGVDGKGFITYTSGKTGNVITFFEKNEDHIAWYIEQMDLGNYWLLKKRGDGFEKLDLASFYQDATGGKLEKSKSQIRRNSTHWEGYLPNLNKIESFFMKNGFIEGEFKQNADGVWTIADAITGATVIEFEAYAGILYKAYNK